MTAWRKALNEPLRGARVIVGIDSLDGVADTARQLLDDGADAVLGLVNTSAPSRSADADTTVPDRVTLAPVELPRATSMLGVIRAEHALLLDPPGDLLRAVDEFDPDGTAVWLGSAFSGSRRLGRRAIGARPDAWVALEDKTVTDQLLAAAGAPAVDHLVVPCSEQALTSAASTMDRGQGTVWSGDSAAGVNGGAEYVHWVREPTTGTRAARRLASDCRRVRVSPFAPGIPCSLHGLVLPDGVAVGRPVELVNLGRPDAGRFLYGGLSSWWDPPQEVRSQMRESVRRIGQHLAAAVGYRGGFGVDGILSDGVWRATEVNTRLTVGLGLLAEAVPGLPLGALQRALVEGRPPGIGAEAFEDLLVPAADRSRTAWVRAFSSATCPDGPTHEPVHGGPGRLQVGDGGEPAGVLHHLPFGAGSVVRWVPADGQLRPGDSVARWASAAFTLADGLWQTGFGPLTVLGP